MISKQTLKIIYILYTNTDSISSLIPFRFHDINYLIDLKAEPLLRAYIISAIKAHLNRENGLKFDDLIKNIDLKDFSDDKFGTTGAWCMMILNRNAIANYIQVGIFLYIFDFCQGFCYILCKRRYSVYEKDNP